jgi:hypothetical protein
MAVCLWTGKAALAGLHCIKTSYEFFGKDYRKVYTKAPATVGDRYICTLLARCQVFWVEVLRPG